MTQEQCRQARRLLGWSQLRLAQAASFDKACIGAFERIGRLPTARSGEDRRVTLRAALEDAGIEFVDNATGQGVRLRSEQSD